jgi:hypothetical protein
MTWRYALLGYVTWHVGKRVIKRKAKRAVGRGSDSNSNSGKPAKRERATAKAERSSDG